MALWLSGNKSDAVQGHVCEPSGPPKELRQRDFALHPGIGNVIYKLLSLIVMESFLVTSPIDKSNQAFYLTLSMSFRCESS